MPESDAACPHCGGDGDNLLSVGGCEYCPACGEEWTVGDYDWTRLDDVLTYHADRQAGRVLDDQPDALPCHSWYALGLHRPVPARHLLQETK